MWQAISLQKFPLSKLLFLLFPTKKYAKTEN